MPGAALISALAGLCAAETRPEARSTAQALRRGDLRSSCPACALDDEIRYLANSDDALPETRLISAAQGLIPWGLSPLSSRQPDNIGAIKAVATLLGPGAPIESRGLLFGLFYQRPDTYYPLHAHAADETYTILAGSALWKAGEDSRWRGTGEKIHHPGQMPHAFRAGPCGFLAIWRWSGDVGFDSYRLLPDPDAGN